MHARNFAEFLLDVTAEVMMKIGNVKNTWAPEAIGYKINDVILRNEEIRRGKVDDLNGGEIMNFIFDMVSLKYRQRFKELA